jgi:lipopolysaccharide biosynthesis glycosyltransferase
MKLEIITSFNQKYYDLIGKDCVDSWLKYWPEEYSLTCYVEEFTMPNHNRIKQIPFDNLPKEYFAFQNSNQNNNREKTFAKKAYSIIHAFENVNADRIIWIDADTITIQPIDTKLLLTCCPDDILATFMGVWHHKDKDDLNSELKFSVESGFFIVNVQHKGFKKFASRYREYYDKKITQGLRRFYDGEVLGAVILELKNEFKFKDLCESFGKKYRSPLPHTDLGKYIVHYKSKGKKIFIKNKKS